MKGEDVTITCIAPLMRARIELVIGYKFEQFIASILYENMDWNK